jgi:hypothetical protein
MNAECWETNRFGNFSLKDREEDGRKNFKWSLGKSGVKWLRVIPRDQPQYH